MPSEEVNVLTHRPVWMPEEPEMLETCKSCGETIFGKLWRLAIWIVDQDKFVDTDSVLCDSCHNMLEKFECK